MRKLAAIVVCAVAAGCGGKGDAPPAMSAEDAAFQQKLQEQFLDAKAGTVIEIPAGKHALDRVLTLRANGVTVRGVGSQKSILSFKNEISGPEGMLVYASDFTIEHLAIEDSKAMDSRSRRREHHDPRCASNGPEAQDHEWRLRHLSRQEQERVDRRLPSITPLDAGI